MLFLSILTIFLWDSGSKSRDRKLHIDNLSYVKGLDK